METMQKPEDNVSPKVNNKIKRQQNNMGTVYINFDLKKKSLLNYTFSDSLSAQKRLYLHGC